MKFFVLLLGLFLAIGFIAGYVSVDQCKKITNENYATYTIHGDHSGTITFFPDETGYAIVDGIKSNEFRWQMKNGIGYGYIKGTIKYWNQEIPITIFTENLTMISPELFPGSYAIMDVNA